MIRSSIDIGTNSVLLLVADCSDGNIDVLHEEQNIPRLGQGVDQSGALSEAAQQRVLDVLNSYKTYLDENYNSISSDTIVTATSAVRDASNRQEFLRRIKSETGWTVRLLSGDDEAWVTYKGALSVIENPGSNSEIIVLDIGGGSTEIARGVGTSLKNSVSLNMGSVRFTERFLKQDPPTDDEIKSARREVKRMLTDWSGNPISFDQLIGVAGTVTSMAGIDLGLDIYNTEKINGHRCSRDFIDQIIEEFQNLKAAEIEKKYPKFLKGRGDVITGGLLILSEFMTWTGHNEVVVSTGGIRHGILLDD
ncbi:Ppx/GppA phosphatase family protein [Rhodohalobacter sp. 8-1]|uniref:Ppx/GppA phosphatase family protein n=1 Tax=Rhodohalobacter sp. 8-1 TaxID=3131972 RepID=UPI0030EB76C2